MHITQNIVMGINYCGLWLQIKQEILCYEQSKEINCTICKSIYINSK